MPIQIVSEQEFLVGQEIVIEGAAPDGPFAVVFEDDGTTAYFYALDTSARKQQIQDAVHIYDVDSVTDRDKPSVVKVGWSLDSQKAVLLINGYPHAVFDFEARQGYCRTDFPPPPGNGLWSKQGHAWSDAAIDLFA